jgi:hypothetical protein
MKSPHPLPSVIIYRPSSNSQLKQSKYLTLGKVSELIAHAAAMIKNDLSEASRSQIYVTNRDEFLDLNAYQSANTSASTNTGVRA